MTAKIAWSIPEPDPFDQLLSLHGQVAIVTGGSRGIGEAIVLRLAQAGASVVATGRNAKALSGVEAKVAEIGGTAMGFTADASSTADSRRLVDETMARFGRVDVLVNNAAVYPGGMFLEINERIWNDTIDTDLRGPFFLSQMVARKMIEAGRGGRIVNVLSTEMVRPTGILASYGAAKAGLLAITQSMARELGQYNILTNCVVPGSTFTEEKLQALREGHLEGPFTTLSDDVPETRKVVDAMYDGFSQAIDFMPMRRPCWPDEIAKAVLFMASSMGSYVNGTSLMVEGGQVL